MTAHTPGRWTLRRDRKGRPERIDGHYWLDGQTGLDPNVTGERHGPPIANVYRLEDAVALEAFPDLLAALELADKCLMEPSLNGRPDGYAQSTTAIRIRAAIAKARGEN